MAAAHAAGLYTNLITSADGIAADTLRQLSEAGLAAAIGKGYRCRWPSGEHDALFRVLSHNDIQHLSDRFLAVLDREQTALSQLGQMPSVDP